MTQVILDIEQLTSYDNDNMQSYLEKKMLDEDLLVRKLAKKKLNFPLKLIVWIRANMTNEVMVKIDYADLDEIQFRLKGGTIAIRTKIEEALLQDHNNSKQDCELMTVTENQHEAKEDHYINQYKKLYVYIYEFMKLISKIILSNTSVFCYIFMVLAHLMNGTFLSLVYPISIFAYALLEETRPKNLYWIFIIIYTCVLLF